MNEIKAYLVPYWEKYPEEKLIDPPLEAIEGFISRGGKYSVDANSLLLILYLDKPDQVDVMAYFLDGGDQDLGKLKLLVKAHKQFVNSFNKPIYSVEMKSIFYRPSRFRKENNLWRWL